MQSPRITEAAFSLLGGEGRHGMHALVRHGSRGRELAAKNFCGKVRKGYG
jgi:hypothetical protein